MASLPIYFIQQVISLSTDAGGTGLTNYPMNHSDIRLFSNVANTVQFFIRDIDRKPIQIATGARATLQIYDKDTGYVLLDDPLTVIDATQGLWGITISRPSIPDWTTRAYTYSVYVADSLGARVPLYTDRGNTVYGVAHIMDGPIPPPRQPIELNPADFVIVNGVQQGGAEAGPAAVNNPSGQCTAAFYLTNFSGKVKVQASLDMSPTPSDGFWFDVLTETYVEQTGTVSASFQGNYVWVRFLAQADAGTTGTVDKIVYAV